MPERIPCVEYGPTNDRCISGFPVTHSICRGGPMKAIFDGHDRKIIPKKASRTQVDNHAELEQLRPVFAETLIDSIMPTMIVGYRDARTAEVRANREIALLSHIFNMTRRWAHRETPLARGSGRTKETPCG
jgi:hypothetical protein